jgi:MFS family permease
MNQGPQPDNAIGRSAMTKAMWRILPLILLAYMVAYIDRVNVSFASLQMNDDLKFSATIYGLGGGLFFLGYALFEVPSSLMLARIRAPQWIARIMITWGLLAAGMMFVRTPLQFYLMRFLLGVAEAGFFPSVIYYFAGWFPMACRGRAVSRIYVASSLAAIVMGAISSGMLGLDGMAGLRGWQWPFLVQGLPGVLLGLILLRFLPDAPVTAPWLADGEKEWIRRELARDAALIGAPVRHNLLAAFANPRVLLLGSLGFLGNGAGGGLLLSAPAVLIAGAGLDTTQVGFLVSLGGGLGVHFHRRVEFGPERRSAPRRLRADGRYCGGSPPSWRCLDADSGGRGGTCCSPRPFSRPECSSYPRGPTCYPSASSPSGALPSIRYGRSAPFSRRMPGGVTKDATGSFRAALIGASVVTVVEALVILYRSDTRHV